MVRDDAGLSTAVQQQLTREVRQFETVFVSDVDLAGRTARLRIFTEDEELGFAGHPVLGAAAVLHSLLAPAADEETWALQLGERTSPYVPGDRTAGSMRRWIRVRPSSDELVTGELADRYRRALGLTPAAAAPRSADAGRQHRPAVPDRAGAARGAGGGAHITTPDFEALLAECGAKFVYVLDPAAPEGRTWDNAGRVEDVATGSAAGPAAGYLIEHGVHPATAPLRSPRADSPAGPAHRGPPRGERRAPLGGRPGGAGGPAAAFDARLSDSEG